MQYRSENNGNDCSVFLDQLDLWLAGEVAAEQSQRMQAHHDVCAGCQQETRLAQQIDSITATLPVQPCPELLLPLARAQGRVERKAEAGLPARLLAAWRQPLVFVPAFAVLLVMLFVQQRLADSQAGAQMVRINGQQYSREEIMRATQDLELALRYLDKYGRYPGEVVHAELEHGRLPESGTKESRDPPTI